MQVLSYAVTVKDCKCEKVTCQCRLGRHSHTGQI